MEYNVSELDPKYDFIVNGASYIGAPKPNTVMFLSKKVEHLLSSLSGISKCLVFVENTIKVPEELTKDNCFVFTAYPQKAYADFVQAMAANRAEGSLQGPYKITEHGYFIGENVQIGPDCKIEPLCLIGPNVTIGAHVSIGSGTRIRDTVLGDRVIVGNNAVLGTRSFTMAEDAKRYLTRIPTLGRIVIGNDVEIGALDQISAGCAGDTVIGDNVKMDTMVYIGHDCVVGKSTILSAGVIVAGYVTIGEHVRVGVNAGIRNRITVGAYSYVGMGSVATKSIAPQMAVAGNPAKYLNWLCRCGEKLDSSLMCPKCGKQYRMVDDNLSLVRGGVARFNIRPSSEKEAA